MCPVGSSSRIRARKGSQVILGTGASVGLEGGRKVVKTARGQRLCQSPTVPLKTCGAPRKTQTPFPPESNFILGDQASDVTSSVSPHLYGKSTLSGLSHKGAWGGGPLPGRSQHVVALKLAYCVIMCHHTLPLQLPPPQLVPCLHFCPRPFIAAFPGQLACLVRPSIILTGTPEKCPPVCLTLSLSSCGSSARSPSPRPPIHLRLFYILKGYLSCAFGNARTFSRSW